MVYNKVKIFLQENAYAELEDSFVDKEQELRAEIQKTIKQMHQNAQMVETNRTLNVNVESDQIDPRTGQPAPKMEHIPFEEIDFSKYHISSDPEWTPENIPKEQCKVWQKSVSDYTWKYIQLYAIHLCARYDIYNQRLNKDDPQYESKKNTLPTCFEQVMHESLISPLMKIIMDNIGKRIDEEEKIVEKKEKEELEKRKGPKRNERKKQDE